jgi:hypothetical protein
MTAPDGKIRIPLNEEASKSTGQIEEFLMQFNGEGIQHIALLTDDLFASWEPQTGPLAGLRMDGGDFPGGGGVQRTLHLHGFESHQLVSPFNLLLELDKNAGNDARRGRAHVAWFARNDFGMRGCCDSQRFVPHHDFARLAVKFEENGA